MSPIARVGSSSMNAATLIGVIMTIVAVGVYSAYKIGWIKK